MRAASSPMEPLNKNILLAGEVIAEKWKIGEKIGEGTFSQIYSAYSIESRDKVAVKVEAPSSLKPVLEWESLILKSLQDCPYVCRYYYHGKHGDSTVLVMELLGDSMSMLRMSPDSIHGVPLAKAISVGLEMLDCIEAFHRHGYVHRDVKASNFALSALPERNMMKRQRYYIIDFGLSRQHLGEDKQVLPARQVAEFRGTSMYASLSSHRRQELGPKDDLWSWFYLVMDFLRGELPWAADAQLKNRQTVLRLKEHYTEANPGLLVEGLPGAAQLMELMDYLQSLNYEDMPDYKRIRKQLQAVGESSLASESDSADEESSADKKEAQTRSDVSAFDWNTFESERERALKWTEKAEEHKDSDGASDLLLTIAKRYKTFFDSDGLSFEEQIQVQSAVYRIEKKKRARASFLAPPPIQSFVKRRQSEQKMRSDALRKRRERDFQVRQSLEVKNEQGALAANENTQVEHGAKDVSLRPVKSESSMELSDTEDVGTRRTGEGNNISASQAQTGNGQPTQLGSGPYHQRHVMPPPPGPQWNRNSNSGGPIPPPPSFPPGMQRSGYGMPPSPPPHAGRFPTNGEIPPPPPVFPPNGSQRTFTPRNGNPEKIPSVRQLDTQDGNTTGYQRRDSQDSASSRLYPAETRPKRPLLSPRDGRQYDLPRETREDRGYGVHQRPQKSPRETPFGPDRHNDDRTEREERGYGYQRTHKSPRESNSLKAGRRYDSPKEDRGYGYQQPKGTPRESHDQYVKEGRQSHSDKEKRPRSRSRSSRRESHRSRRRSHSSSRSRSWSYSRSPSRSPSPHPHRRSSRDYDRHRGSRKVKSKREHSRRHRSRSCSSSRSRSRSSSRSVSASPPPKRSRRRSSDLSHSRSSHRHSSRRHSKEYAKKDFPEDAYPKEYMYAKKYPQDYRCRSPSPERRHSHPREPQFRHSPSPEAPRHRSQSRDYAREDGSWGEKQRRSSRWQSRS
ncbi:tau-tubulin kinase, putative [Phytophthora infestans T30-4]|uniref:Casein kinase I n=2 Tax=Phytophthora infestans TaxID=4787 RepID=D0NS55_PHYIT|nr:tau-tubulin kinase, putative [Phytophthora infestans T30-4]EEY63596.1 tau-tubulin kinase, putative [Phytophthora infestans T30-4]|eukprot:XP_002898183.1 tau-tubulin kinase, putative [Phytophthora infestans T30-4]